MDVTGKTVLVTGASSGIGRQFALGLAEQGAHLVLVARQRHTLNAIADEIGTAQPASPALVLPMDLSLATAGADLAAELARRGVRVDMLINNAGVGSHGRFSDEDPETMAQQIQLNVASLVDLTARFLPGMVEAGSGAIVNVASTAAFQPVPTMAVYAATKAFVLSFTEALWREVRDSNVRVLTLCPGPTETAFFSATGKEFLTRGRQNPEQVITTALRALDADRPTVVSGLSNRLNSMGYRFLPRTAMLGLSERLVRSVPRNPRGSEAHLSSPRTS